MDRPTSPLLHRLLEAGQRRDRADRAAGHPFAALGTAAHLTLERVRDAGRPTEVESERYGALGIPPTIRPVDPPPADPFPPSAGLGLEPAPHDVNIINNSDCGAWAARSVRWQSLRIGAVTWTDRLDRWTRAHPVVPDTLLALAIAAVLGQPSLEILQVARSPAWVLWVAGICGFVVVATVAIRRIATSAAFFLASLAMVVTIALPNTMVKPAGLGLAGASDDMEIPLFFLPSSAVYLMLLYAVAAQRPRPKSLLALGIGVTGAVLCTARTATAYGALPAGWLTLLLAFLALVAAVAGTWAVGCSHFDRRQRLVEAAAEAAERAAADERQRIARDMHDIVAHSLAVIVRQAEGGAAIAAKSPDRAAQALSVIAGAARDALADMRGTLQVLRDAAASDGVQPSLSGVQPSFDEIATLVEQVRATGIEVRLVERGSAHALTAGAGVAAYRLIQEALTNSIKHAGPHPTVTVTISHGPDGSVVVVDDDGGDAEVQPAVPGTGAGLHGVQERVHAAGGAFEAGPVDGGFRVRAEFRVGDRELSR
jgi:signal transduction histidine kinase